MSNTAETRLEEFVVPVESRSNGGFSNQDPLSGNVMVNKREISQLTESQRAPESPDMKFARTRLGHLLNGIRTGEIQTSSQPAKRRSSPGDFEDLTGLQKRPKKLLRRERRVVFELRGKPFSLRDTGRTEAVYSLCRIWMRGKEEERPKSEATKEETPEPSEEAIDLLATKEITALPKPQDGKPANPAPPPFFKKPTDKTTFSSVNELLQDSLPHWKDVKRNWCDYAKIRDKRFNKSIQMLETVYAIAQQNPL